MNGWTFLQLRSDKKRFQYCLKSDGPIIHMRTIQGHSGGTKVDLALLDTVEIPFNCTVELIAPFEMEANFYYVGCSPHIHSILQSSSLFYLLFHLVSLLDLSSLSFSVSSLMHLHLVLLSFFFSLLVLSCLVSCLLSLVSCLLSLVSCLFVSCLLSLVSCLLSLVSCLLSLVSCLLSLVSCLLSLVSCLLSLVLSCLVLSCLFVLFCLLLFRLLVSLCLCLLSLLSPSLSFSVFFLCLPVLLRVVCCVLWVAGSG